MSGLAPAEAARRRRAARGSSVDSLWREVISGRLTVVPHKDVNGRRDLHLQPAQPGPQPHANLTERERLVIGHRASGQGLKRIASELGVSVPTVARCLSQALGKLGLERDIELPRVLGAAVRQHLLSIRQPETDWRAPLSSTEADVAHEILFGLSNAEIAEKRGTAVRTIANQVASIYRKLRVRSRLELSLYALAGRHAFERRSRA
jgi:DNA-binding NarL/FixJ family response regulator